MKPIVQILRDRALTPVLADLVETLNREVLPVLRATRELVNRLAAAPEQETGPAGQTETIDWSAYHYRDITLSQTCQLTFIAPTGAAELVLRVTQDSIGGWGITWPTTTRWVAGTPPALGGLGPNKVALVRLYCDGTLYYGVDWLDFLP